MKNTLIGLVTIVFSLGAQPLHATGTLDPGRKIALQSYAVSQMQDLVLSEGIYYADAETMDIRFISPTANHPMIFANKDGMYVLCFEGLDQFSEPVPIDVYIIDTGSDFKLQDIRFGGQSRAAFESMMEAGMFTPV